MPTTANTGRMVKIEILRQDTEGGATRTEKFSIPYRHGMNVISALMEIQKNPVTEDYFACYLFASQKFDFKT